MQDTKTANRRKIAAWSCLLLASAPGHALAAEVQVRWLDGQQAMADWLGMAGTRSIRLKIDGSPREVSIADLQDVRFRRPGRTSSGTMAPSGPMEFFVAGGGRLRGVLGLREEGKITVRSGLGGRGLADGAHASGAPVQNAGPTVTIPFDRLVGAILARSDADTLPRELFERAIANRSPGKDTLVTHKRDESKLIQGRLVALGNDGGAFEFGGRVRSFSLDKIYGVVLARGVGTAIAPPARIHLIDGTIWPGRMTAADAHALRWRTTLDTALSLPLEQIELIEWLSSRVTYVSAMPPIEQETQGIIHAPWPVRFNRTATAQPIRLGGILFDSGIGCHSYTRIAYDLKGGYETFVATLGIDDSVRPRGSVVFRVEGDGAVLFESETLTGQSEPKPVSIDVREIDVLSLIVDYGDALDLSDHAVWAGARLIAPQRPSSFENAP